MAQKPTTSTSVVDDLYLCLKRKFPEVRRSFEGRTAFDSQSGRNFAWDDDKQAWIDTKTLESICPKSPDNLYLCLKRKFPEVRRSFEGRTAFDPQSGRNFAWDEDKQAWIDIKTLECICPKCPPIETAQPPPPTEHALAPPPQQPTLAVLVSTGKINVEISGTGETIGHIGDLTVQNLSDQALNFVIPPTILESKTGKNQNYACPRGRDVTLAAHETKIVPMYGVCLERNIRPLGKGVTGDSIMNTGDPNTPQNPDSHISSKAARDLLRICTAKYDAADKLQKDGALKDFPYKDKQKQKDILVQWSTWMDPRISEIAGAPPATKENLKKVVYKQVEEKGRMTPDTKKKIDEGLDTIFDKIELTTAKAKDLERPSEEKTTEEKPLPHEK